MSDKEAKKTAGGGLSRRMKEMMEERSISQSELAGAIGVTQPAVWRLLNGSSQTSRKILDIAAIFGVSPHWLLTGKGKKYARRDFAGGFSKEVFIDAVSAKKMAVDSRALIDKAQQILSVSFASFYAGQLLTGYDPKNVQLMTMFDDSMAPTIEDGALLLLDSSVNDVDVDGVYLFHFKGDLSLRRLQKKGGVLGVLTDNERYRDFDINQSDRGDVSIIGKVIKATATPFKSV